jgi:hypothetical protein
MPSVSYIGRWRNYILQTYEPAAQRVSLHRRIAFSQYGQETAFLKKSIFEYFNAQKSTDLESVLARPLIKVL